jgi:hypothetical protein
LVSGVALYGGFVGTEDQRARRDWTAHPTLLSGEIGAAGVDDNSCHVVTGTSVTETAVLDGFTVTGGYARDGCTVSAGGGMYNESGSPTLNNVTFSGNSADDYGGGMYNHTNSNPVLTNVTFSGNSAYHGGGMNNWYSSPTLTDVTFSGNSADDGGGMFNYYHSSPTLTDVTFSGDSAEYGGGGMFNYHHSSPTLNNVAFRDNSTAGIGGGMYNCTDSHPVLTNVTLSGNSAGLSAGGMWNSAHSNPTLTGVTFSGNSADDGGAMYNSYSSPKARNSIFWNNQDASGTGTLAASIANFNSAITLIHSLVQGSGGSSAWTSDPSYVDGGGNLDADPLFVLPVDPATAPTTAGNLRLRRGSPAIDAGDNAFVTDPLDLDGNPRIGDGDGDGTATVDMGAYEFTTHPLYLPLILNPQAE